MSRYAKGARMERELLAILTQHGYSVVRSAGSGVNAVSPDLIAIKNGKVISIECKAWNKGSISLDKDKYNRLVQWQANTATPTFVAWRMNREGWYFVTLDEFEETPSAYNITKKKVIERARTLNEVLNNL